MTWQEQFYEKFVVLAKDSENSARGYDTWKYSVLPIEVKNFISTLLLSEQQAWKEKVWHEIKETAIGKGAAYNWAKNEILKLPSLN